MPYCAGFESPDRFELIVVGPIGVVLLTKLPADNLSCAHLGIGAVAIAEGIELTMQIGEAIADDEVVSDLPGIGNRGANKELVRRGKRCGVLCRVGYASDGRSVEVDETVGVWSLVKLASVRCEVDHMVRQLPLQRGSEFMIVAVQTSESIRMREGTVDSVVKPRNRCWACKEVAVGDRAERTTQHAHAIRRIRRRREVNKTDCAAGCAAAE